MFSNQPALTTLPPLNGARDCDRAIVATLLYYDLFDFALRAHEVQRFAHRAGPGGHFELHEIPHEAEWWSSEEDVWFLKGREHLRARRAELARESAEKLVRARRWARLLQIIPGVRFIGVTGSLAMEGAVAEDDIDLLIIAARGRLWQTRALVLAALWSLGVKRQDDGRADHPDQVCANIFLGEDDLTIPEQNIFIAHEICQMLPLFGPGAYRHFIQANAWAREFLPQWQPIEPKWQDRLPLRAAQRAFEIALGGPIRRGVERELSRRQLARIQHKHARGHNVGVKLTPTQLRFHPRDLSQYIVSTFEARWQMLNAHPEPLQEEGNFQEPFQVIDKKHKYA